MSAKYKSPSFLLPNELNTNTNPLNTDGNPATGTGINSLYSMNFNGSSYIDTGFDGLNNASAITFSLWAKTPSKTGYMFGATTSSVGWALNLYQATTVYFYPIPGANTNLTFPISSSGITNNEWFNLVIVFDGSQSVNTDKIKIYINGNPISYNTSSTFPSVLPSTYTSTLWLGKTPQSNYNFSGQMDEVSIFNRALNDDERAALYDGTGSNIRPSNLMASNLGPIAYYPLGEQAQNSGYPGNTTPANNVWQFPNGVLQDYVMDFDGSNDYIDANTTVQSNLDFSVSAWINPVSYDKAILGTRPTTSAGSSNGFTININSSGNLWGRIFTQSTVTQVQTGSVISLNNWSHIAITYQSSSKTLKTYLNGSEVGSVVGNVSSVASINNLNIGRASIGSSLYSYFNGSISNTQIFNSVIPGTGTNSIETLYNNSSPLTDMSGFTSLTNWWKLNADSVYTPSAPNYTTALDFNGSNQYVTIGNPPSVQFTNDFTITGWFKTTSTALQRIISKDNAASGGRSYFIRVDSVLTGGIFVNNSGKNNNSSFTVNDGNWHFFSFVYEQGTGTTLYVDNNTPSFLSETNNVDNGSADLEIGRRQDNQRLFNGSISNVALFNSALTASQISTLFNFGTPETNISFDPTAWWKLEDQNAITDSSGNGNTGTNNGATDTSSGVAFTPSWKIPTALPIPSANYTTALEFNGLAGIPSYAASYINTNYTGLSGATEFSMSFWLKCDDITADNSFFGNRNNSNRGISGQIHSSTFYTYLQSGANYASFTTASVGVVSGQWFNIVFFYNGSGASNTDRLKIYINGNIATYSLAGTVPSSLDVSTQPLWIGSGNRVASGFGGEISNFALWNTNQLTNLNNIWNLGTPQLSSYNVTPTIWYKMNDTTSGIQDSSGNNNNGTNSNSTKVFSNVVAGNIPVNGVSTTLPSTALQQSDLQFDSPYSNYSLKFSTSQSIDTNFTLPASYTSYSYSFWYRSTAASIGTGDYYIISNFDSSNTNLSGTRGAVRFNNSTKMRIFGGDNTNYYLRQYEVGSSLLDQQWHNVVVTFTNTEVLLYVDGVSISAETTTNTPITGFAANRSYTIGQSGINSGYLINSKLDEFAIFDKKLTEAEILSIYNNGKPSDISPIAPTNWWRLGENAYFVNNNITLPNSIAGAPNGVSSGTATSMLSADAPGTYANGIGDGLAITDRVGDAPLSVANSQSYNMIPDDKVPYVPGYVGAQTNNVYSMTFDGVDDYFSALSPGFSITTEWSVSCWIKTNDGSVDGNSYRAFFATGAYGSSGLFKLSVIDTNGYVDIWEGNSSRITGNTNVVDNAWHNVVLTKNSSTLTLFVDGSQQNQVSNSSTWLFSDVYIAAGGPTSSDLVTNGMWSGQIDEVAIFNKALTADQVKFDLYEPTALVGGVEKTADIENNTNLPTPLAWYRMGD